MSFLCEPGPSLVFVSILYSTKSHKKEDLVSIFEKRFGSSVIFCSDYFPMRDYYSKEMGENLERFILVSTKSVHKKDLVSIKLWACDWERETLKNSKRTLNCDPGIISLENVVLATGKPYSHRVYMDRGVYSELTYFFKNRSYHFLEWTYPDYQKLEFVRFFNWARQFLV